MTCRLQKYVLSFSFLLYHVTVLRVQSVCYRYVILQRSYGRVFDKRTNSRISHRNQSLVRQYMSVLHEKPLLQPLITFNVQFYDYFVTFEEEVRLLF